MRRVAITGLGAITPVGNDVATMWRSLLDGVNGIGPITRFDTAGHRASLAAEVRGFDPGLYMEPNEARKSDLYMQYAMGAACQAMADSGLAGTVEPERFGVYFGSAIGGIASFTAGVDTTLYKGPRRVSPHFVPMVISNMAAGSIAIRFGAMGAALPVTTACATGTNAVGEAYRAIRHGYADAILAGGSEAAITPVGVAGFGAMMALSPSDDPNAASLPFDARRSGFVIGEGAGALVLEEYGHAKARGATIYAEVCGYGCTCDAHHITAPHPEAAGGARAIALALEEAQADIRERVYVNAHGTGTKLNDAAETVALKRVFGERAGELAISSSKSMIGHALGAAGAIEAIVAILSLRDKAVHPTINLTTPDPDCDLDYVAGVRRAFDATLALSLSFGFGGHNACVAFAPEGSR